MKKAAVMASGRRKGSFPSSPLQKRTLTASQKLAASLAGEYVLALAWPLSTVLYAWLSPLLATLVGALVVWPLLVRLVSLTCPRKNPPRVSPAFILVDGFYLTPESMRQRGSTMTQTEGPVLALIRLALHWLGGFSGFYLLNLCFGEDLRVAVEHGLDSVWSGLRWAFIGSSSTATVTGPIAGGNGALYVFAFHVFIQGFIGSLQMRYFAVSKIRTYDLAQVQAKSIPRLAWYKTGALFASLGYPWAAPHFSLGSFLWVVKAAGLSSLTLMTASILSCFLSAILAVCLYEASVGRSARLRKRPVLDESHLGKSERGVEDGDDEKDETGFSETEINLPD
jgi:hypothetical protein